jgi:hypothetical protein
MNTRESVSCFPGVEVEIKEGHRGGIWSRAGRLPPYDISGMLELGSGGEGNSGQKGLTRMTVVSRESRERKAIKSIFALTPYALRLSLFPLVPGPIG